MDINNALATLAQSFNTLAVAGEQASVAMRAWNKAMARWIARLVRQLSRPQRQHYWAMRKSGAYALDAIRSAEAFKH